MKITTVDTHTEGQATRTVVSGLGELPGDTVVDRRREFRYRYEHLRTGLLREPRGHPGMFGAVLIDPCDPRADFGVLFLHQGGYVDASVHGTIGVATALVETGIVVPDGDGAGVALETPVGVVLAHVDVRDGRAERVTVRNVPSWVGLPGASLQVPSHGEVIVDVAFGGNLCVWAWAEHLGIDLAALDLDELSDVALRVRDAANEKLVVRDPDHGERLDVDVAVILDAPHNEMPAVRSVAVHSGGQVDRSPAGTAASARLAVMFDRGEVMIDDEVTIESAVTNGTLTARVVESTRVGARNAVVAEITGSAHVTGIHDFVFDPEDPLCRGFVVGRPEPVSEPETEEG